MLSPTLLTFNLSIDSWRVSEDQQILNQSVKLGIELNLESLFTQLLNIIEHYSINKFSRIWMP